MTAKSSADGEKKSTDARSYYANQLYSSAAKSSENASENTSENGEITEAEVIVKSPNIQTTSDSKSVTPVAAAVVRPNSSNDFSFRKNFYLIGNSLGFGNMIVFPYLFLKPRAAYFFPLIVCYALVGIPIMLIEAVVGQYSGLHPNIVFSRISPILNSIGGAFSMIIFYRTLFLMPLAALCLSTILQIIVNGYRDTCVDPTTCIQYAQIDRCSEYLEDKNYVNFFQIPEDCEYFLKRILNSSNIVRIGSFADMIYHDVLNSDSEKTAMLNIGILFGLWLLLAALLLLAPRRMTQISSVIAIIALVITCILFVFTVIAGKLPLDLFTPQWNLLLDPIIWVSTVISTLFSLSLCDGGVIRLTSYNSFNNNIFFDVMSTIFVDFVVTLVYIYITFTAIGHTLTDLYPNLDTVRQSVQQITADRHDAYLVCSFGEFALRVSPPVIGELMASLYFGCIALLIFQSSLISYESLIIAFIRRCKISNKHARESVVVIICVFSATFSSYLVFPRKINLFFLILDVSIVFLSLVAFLEVLALSYLYGYKHFCRDIETMIGWRPTFIHYIEVVAWKLVTPLILGVTFVLVVSSLICMIFENDSAMTSFAIPKLVVLCTSLTITPLYIFYQLYRMHRENRKKSVLLEPVCDWGRYQPVMQDDAFINDETVLILE